MGRSYEQTCYIARSLDILGERWTLLIVRELTLGPRRYGDLLGALPGIGTNLLATRLRDLEQNDIVRRAALPGPGRAAAYVLTARGEALTPALAALADWGAGLPEPPSHHTGRAAWIMVAMRLTAPQQAAAFDTITELQVGGEVLWLHGDGSQVRLAVGPAPVTPGLRLTCERATFYALAAGRMTVDEACESGDLAVDGGFAAAALFFTLFNLPAGARDPQAPSGAADA
ncbi:winged helix-turn-helix transcriptional regulator [Streptomyces chartreusis]|uniref:winged helix-turn-helix transcriptional regulator n=1 Tax=Streptomyces chartreusis TaxID=1969 RepID=UPI003D8BF6D3